MEIGPGRRSTNGQNGRRLRRPATPFSRGSDCCLAPQPAPMVSIFTVEQEKTEETEIGKFLLCFLRFLLFKSPSTPPGAGTIQAQQCPRSAQVVNAARVSA